MAQFIVRRLQTLIPVIVLVSMLSFSLILLLPGDPAMMMLGEQNLTDRTAYLALRAELGLDKPIPLQYLDWATRALQGNLGSSLRDHLPIGLEITSHLFPTVELSILAMIFALIIAIPAGTLSALKPGSLLDHVATVIALSGVAVPSFFLGILLIYIFSLGLRLIPPSGYVSPLESLGGNLRLMILPAFALGSAHAAVLTRQIRSALIEVLQQEYIMTARSKGLTEAAVVIGHAFRNALVPVVTIIGLQVGTLIGGAVVIETVFSIPGMGRLIVDSIFQRDFPTVQAAVLILALSVLLANLLTDVLYAYIDPRIRYG
ncbi:MAG TPA: ABC transporter permease [Chloroflexota bacterium]|nr:ABC transporter permease [Chloroflexota bacterium]